MQGWHKSPPLSKGLLCWDRSPGSGYNPQRLNPMALSPGSRLGPYQVTALIGSGGMGEVWRAREIAGSQNLGPSVLLHRCYMPDSGPKSSGFPVP